MSADQANAGGSTGLESVHTPWVTHKKRTFINENLVSTNTSYQKKSTDGQREYIGLTANSFKTRFATHKSSFNHANKSTSTALSSYIWSLKNENTPFTTNWSILSLAPSYSKKTRSCQLCLSEKTLILLSKQKNGNNIEGIRTRSSRK